MMANPYVDPYLVLELPRTATAEQIKQAYFAQVRAHPPEREPALFKHIRAAYERLRDPDRRAEADMLLIEPWPEPARKRRPPRLDLKLHHEDVIAGARALTDLGRADWREHHGKVKL